MEGKGGGGAVHLLVILYILCNNKLVIYYIPSWRFFFGSLWSVQNKEMETSSEEGVTEKSLN